MKESTFTREELLEKICVFDSRSPYWCEGDEPRDNCYCSNCIKQLSPLAEFALTLLQKNEDLDHEVEMFKLLSNMR